MVIEYAKFGNLRQYLRARRPTISDYVDTSTGNSSLTEEKRKEEDRTSMTDLISFSFQIARGMEYLESKKVCDANFFKQLSFIVFILQKIFRTMLSPGAIDPR